MSVRRSCRLAQLRPPVWYQKSEARDQSALRLRIREIAMDRPRFGYLRVLVMLKREGWKVGKKCPLLQPLRVPEPLGGRVALLEENLAGARRLGLRRAQLATCNAESFTCARHAKHAGLDQESGSIRTAASRTCSFR